MTTDEERGRHWNAGICLRAVDTHLLRARDFWNLGLEAIRNGDQLREQANNLDADGHESDLDDWQLRMRERQRLMKESQRLMKKSQSCIQLALGRLSACVCDTHIAWMCFLQLERVGDRPELGTIRDEFQPLFDGFAEPRNSIQHIDERILDTRVTSYNNLQRTDSHIYLQTASDQTTFGFDIDPTAHTAKITHKKHIKRVLSGDLQPEDASTMPVRTAVDLYVVYARNMQAFEGRIRKVAEREFPDTHGLDLDHWGDIQFAAQ